MAGGVVKRILQLDIAGNASGASSALKEVASAADATGVAHDNASRMIGNAMAVAGAAVLAFGLKSAATASNVGVETFKVQRFFGGTAESASALRGAAELAGVGVDSLTRGFGKFSKAIEAHPQTFLKDFGVSAYNSSGQLKSLNEMLPSIADKFASMPAGVDKTALVLKDFGKQGMELMPFLNRGAAGIEELQKKAESLGLVLSGSQLEAIKDNRQAHRDFSAALEGMQTQIGVHVLPVLTSMMEKLAGLVPVLTHLINPVTLGVAGFLAMAGVMAKIVTFLSPLASGLMSGTAALRAWAAAQIEASIGMAPLLAGIAVVAAAVAGAVIVWDKWHDAMNDSAKTIEHAKHLDHLSMSMDQLRAAAEQDGAVAAKLDGQSKSSFWLWDRENAAGAADMARRVADDASHLVDVAQGLADQTGMSSEQALKWVQSQDKLGHTFKDSAEAVRIYTGNIDPATMSQDEYAAAVKQTEDNLKSLDTELHALMDPLFAMEKATESNRAAQEKSTSAGVALYLAQVNLENIQKNHPGNAAAMAAATDGVTKAQRDLAAATTATGESALGLEIASNKLKTELGNGTITLSEANAKLDEWHSKHLISDADLKNLQNQLYIAAGNAQNLGNQHPDLHITSNVKEVEADFQRLNAAAIATNGGSYLWSPSQGYHLPGSAGGGGLSDGWNITGENGPELLYKSGATIDVYPNTKPVSGTAPMMAMAAAPAVVNVGDITLQSVSPGYDADALIDTIDARLRQRGFPSIGGRA